MGRLKRWLYLLGGLLLVLGLGYVLLGLVFTDFLVDVWWFQALGYGGYFWLRLGYRYLIFGAFTLVFFLVFFLNFWVASRFLGTAPPDAARPLPARPGYQTLVAHFRSGSLKVYTPFSLVLGVVVALPLFRQWEATLLYFFAPATGVADPVFGKDIGYYLFALPVYLLVLDELLAVFLLLLLGLLLLYWLEKRFLARQGQSLPRGAGIHLSVLVGGLFLLGGWNFWLQRHTLLYTASHGDLFFGPGFVEMRVVLPLIWLSMALLGAVAVMSIRYLHSRRGLRPLIALALIWFLVLWARYSPALPDFVEKYYVKPDEISRERPFIAHHIQATLAAYDLGRVETREYPIREVPWDLQGPQISAALRNIPVWDKEILLGVYEQLQELRTYYNFTSVDVDRYLVQGAYQQVFLAPRELNLDELPPGARSWVNERLKYTHGYGAVMTPASQRGEDPMTWFIQGIPPTSEFGFTMEQPAIYYGLGKMGPAIAPNDSHEMGYPTEGGHTAVDYQGKGDVALSSMFRKLIFSLYFKERDIFFTTKTNAASRMLFRRHIVERVKALTPFFQLDEDPYIVVTPKGLYWILDGYTASDRYPYAQPFREKFNYIRNSVKIVVDAYHGTVTYYLADDRDPIIRAYQRMYPGLLKNLDRLPPELKPHLRYPKGMFDIQMAIYGKYHQTDPEVYYKQEDLWEFPEISQGEKTLRMRSYYLTLNLLDPQKSEFFLLAPMTPRARANLRALCTVGCDGANYGKLIVYSFPKGAMVFGPSQVDAFIDQDTTISEQFSLWNQMGSRVARGRMILLPVANSIVYIQPVYLEATAKFKIPQLKRLIVSKGELVSMEPSLERGFEKLNERFKAQAERMKPRLQPQKQ